MDQNKIKNYSLALARALAEKDADGKKIAENFLKLLQKENCFSKAKEILALAQKEILRDRGGRKIVFETARQATGHQAKLLHGIAGKEDVVEGKINPDLIAGVKITIDNEKQFDASMLRKINNLF